MHMAQNKAKMWKAKKPAKPVIKKDKKSVKSAKPIKGRIFVMMQYFKHPETGEQLWSLDDIQSGLNHKTIKKFAWAVHDRDVWHDFDAPFLLDRQGEKIPARDSSGKYLVDEIKEKYYYRDLSKKGQARPAHAHVVIQLTQALPLESIARWFKIPRQYLQVKKGVGTFISCVKYLTHEDPAQQERGKYRYSDSDIHANFDFRSEIDHKLGGESYIDNSRGLREQIQAQVASGSMTVNEVLKAARTDQEILTELSSGSANWLQTLYNARQVRLAITDLPPQRTNIYLTGSGGSGKTQLAKAIARSLFPQHEEDDDIFYVAGNNGNTFDSYDGQPVIIWDDFRGKKLSQVLGGLGVFLNVFDSHPLKQKQNKKFGEVSLINTYNIIASVQSPADFRDDIMKDEDQSQFYRRFPFFIIVHTDDYQMYVSESIVDPTKPLDSYISEMRFKNNIKELLSAYPDRKQRLDLRTGETQLTKPIIGKVKEIERIKKADEGFENHGGEIARSEHATLFGKSISQEKSTQKNSSSSDNYLPF